MTPERSGNHDVEDRYYSISEVSTRTDVPVHILRQWEARFPQLKPKRSRTNRRQYTQADIAIVNRIKQLHRHEQRSTAGVRRQLTMELEGVGKPKTRQEARDLVDKIAAEARALLDILDDE